MGVPTSEVGYTSATTTKSMTDMWWHWKQQQQQQKKQTTLHLHNMITQYTARYSVRLYVSQNLLFSVSKCFIFSKVCHSLGRQGSESCHCFQNKGVEEGGRSDHMPSHMNKMQCSIAPLRTNNL
jgi:hypothetical protein